ncbi:MAG TPA: M1 family aminopeptidase, partial [Bacteroidota bacterium]
REVVVNLPFPLKPDDSVTVVLTYSGFIFGYPEVMAYVKDRIDENYSLLRPDAFAYPVLAEPTFASALAANDTKFTYEVIATVPNEYNVACGGELVDSRIDSVHSTFTFRSKIPTWRIDVAVAKFTTLIDSNDRIVISHLPEDSAGAQNILNASKAVIEFYSKMFGRPKSFKGYSIIEIPDGWGSQASDYYFLQTAAAFRDTSRISEVYHEIGHTWNATPAQEVQRCRYFDEAFASFFEAMAIGAFHGETAFEEDMDKSRDLFVRWAQHDRQVFDTPIAGYGVKELGRHSYTKGAWSLYVLSRLVGEKTFALIIRNMLKEFTQRGIDFNEFQNVCERTAKKNLDKFFQEWVYGTESSQLLVDKIPIDDIVRRY